MTNELRAMQVDSDAGGGFITTPIQFAAELLQSVRNLTFVRQLATVHTGMNAGSFGIPTLASNTDDGEWVAELAIGGETELSFGMRELKPHPMSKLAKVSRRLLRVSIFDVEAIVRDALAYMVANTEEKKFMVGTGVNQPLGIFTASDFGIPTSQDTTAAISFDGLTDVKYALDDKYLENACWVMHKDLQKALTKIKNALGEYIWRPSVREGEPDRLLDLPLKRSAHAPNTLTSTNYVAVLGDFRYYHIADSLEMTIQRLEEVFYATNQVGFVMRKETDGMPVLAEAFRRMKVS
jgi:HK97 family phage major capsid protein